MTSITASPSVASSTDDKESLLWDKITKANNEDSYYQAVKYFLEHKSFQELGSDLPSKTLSTIRKKCIKGDFRLLDNIVQIKYKEKREKYHVSGLQLTSINNSEELAHQTRSKEVKTTSVNVEDWKDFVSEQSANILIRELHDKHNHPSREPMRIHLRSSKYFRIGLQSLIDKFYIGNTKCALCSMLRRSNTVEAITPILSSYPFERLQADYTFPRGRDDYCLATFKDHFTRRAWVFVSRRKTQINIVECLKKIIEKCKIKPKILQTDNGAEFGKEVEQFCEQEGIKVIHGRPYHPRTQGSIEKFNGTITRKLFKRLVIKGLDDVRWREVVDECVDEYNTTVHSVTGFSPNDAWNVCLINEMSTEDEKEKAAATMLIIAQRMKKRAESDAARKNKKVRSFVVGAVIWVDMTSTKIKRKKDNTVTKRTKLAQIIEAPGNHTYKIRWLEKHGFGKECQNSFHRYCLKSNRFVLVPQEDYDNDRISTCIGMPLTEFLNQYPMESAGVAVKNKPVCGFEKGEMVFLHDKNFTGPIGMGEFQSITDSIATVILKHKFVSPSQLDEFVDGHVVWDVERLKSTDPTKTIRKQSKDDYESEDDDEEPEAPKEWDEEDDESDIEAGWDEPLETQMPTQSTSDDEEIEQVSYTPTGKRRKK